MIHTLKTWPEFFAAVKSGEKRFETRLNDRPFAVGDCLVLQEFDPAKDSYTGEMFAVRVLYLTDQFQRDGYVTMSIEPWVADAPAEGR